MPPPDLRALLDLAVDVATGAGDLLLSALAEGRTAVDTKSSSTDMVTEMDRAAEAHIVQQLREARPDDGLLGEEGTHSAGSSGVRWIIDPLDGTTNYLYRLPVFAVSVAAEVDGEVAVGVVRDPSHDETFTATRGGGARRNTEELRVDGPPALASALVATGFAYIPDRRRWQADVLAHMLPAVRDVRRAGSAAIDLCWAACGRVDLQYEHGLNVWDFAAGALIASEAGAWVGNLEGDAPSSDLVMTAPPHLAESFRRLLTEAETSAAR